MAITFPTVFQSTITTDPAATGAGYLTPARYNQGCSIAGLSSTSGALLYSTDATTLAQDGTNLLYTTSSGPRLQVGSGTTTLAGFLIGYSGTSGFGGIWHASVTPTLNNSVLFANASQSFIGLPSSGLNIRDTSGNTRMSFLSAVGSGPLFSCGSATTDVQALSATQTWNAAGVTFTGIKYVATVTAAAAGSLLADLQTAGGGSMFSVRASDGLITTGGTAGVSSFGPSAVTSITVKNGIITAIS